jgi:hypothetical protein
MLISARATSGELARQNSGPSFLAAAAARGRHKIEARPPLASVKVDGTRVPAEIETTVVLFGVSLRSSRACLGKCSGVSFLRKARKRMSFLTVAKLPICEKRHSFLSFP